MRGKLVTLCALALLAALFAVFVWPTLYRYDRVTLHGDTFPIRTNRFTGAVEQLGPDDARWAPR